MTNYTNDCQYEVQTREGMERMSGHEAERRFGSRIWTRYAEVIDHSPWCPCRERSHKFEDPFFVELLDSEPPF